MTSLQHHNESDEEFSLSNWISLGAFEKWNAEKAFYNNNEKDKSHLESLSLAGVSNNDNKSGHFYTITEFIGTGPFQADQKKMVTTKTLQLIIQFGITRTGKCVQISVQILVTLLNLLSSNSFDVTVSLSDSLPINFPTSFFITKSASTQNLCLTSPVAFLRNRHTTKIVAVLNLQGSTTRTY